MRAQILNFLKLISNHQKNTTGANAKGNFSTQNQIEVIKDSEWLADLRWF